MYERLFAPSNPSGGVLIHLEEPERRKGFEGHTAKSSHLTNEMACWRHAWIQTRMSWKRGWTWAGWAAGHPTGGGALEGWAR